MYDSTKDTQDHIDVVADFLNQAADELTQRGWLHDQSKLHNPEKHFFDVYTPGFDKFVFGSPEYTEQVKRLKPALDHHYANNTHHPQHYENGINGMNLFDIVEMFYDWMASSQRTKDGDIRRSIDINAERFGISKQLRQILINTLEYEERGKQNIVNS